MLKARRWLRNRTKTRGKVLTAIVSIRGYGIGYFRLRKFADEWFNVVSINMIVLLLSNCGAPSLEEEMIEQEHQLICLNVVIPFI